MNILKRNIPNAITCINLLGGVLATMFAVRPFETSGGLMHYEWAWLCIVISAVADFFDGFAARLLHVKSDMGKELDSLSDNVSFGVAPAVLMVTMLGQAAGYPWWVWFSLLISAGGALRLAKFNLDTRQTTSFLGLPIPANAMFWIGYSAAVTSGYGFLALPWVFLPVMLLEVWLMNSELPLISLKFQNWSWGDNLGRWLLIGGSVALLAVCGVAGLMWVVLYYIILSLFLSHKDAEKGATR